MQFSDLILRESLVMKVDSVLESVFSQSVKPHGKFHTLSFDTEVGRMIDLSNMLHKVRSNCKKITDYPNGGAIIAYPLEGHDVYIVVSPFTNTEWMILSRNTSTLLEFVKELR